MFEHYEQLFFVKHILAYGKAESGEALPVHPIRLGNRPSVGGCRLRLRIVGAVDPGADATKADQQPRGGLLMQEDNT